MHLAESWHLVKNKKGENREAYMSASVLGCRSCGSKTLMRVDVHCYHFDFVPEWLYRGMMYLGGQHGTQRWHKAWGSLKHT